MKLIISNKSASCWFNFQRIKIKYNYPFPRKLTDIPGTTHDKGIQKQPGTADTGIFRPIVKCFY